MNKKGKIYVIITVIAILAIVFFEYTKPQKLNWFQSYAKQHKIPFGTYVFHDQLKRIFSEEHIIDVNRPPYEYLTTKDSISGTYIFVNNSIEFDDVELDELLDWTSKGNTLFIASESFNEKLMDTINANYINVFNYGSNFYVELKNKHLIKDSIYVFDKDNAIRYFNAIDTLQTSVLGTVSYSNKVDSLKAQISHLKTVTDSTHLYRDNINVIRQPFGKGTIILSMFPQAFTNYFVLKTPNHNYTAGLLSYIDDTKPVYLDAYYKSGKIMYTSPLYVLLNTKQLKWAYYMMLIGVFVYVIFEGKRKQRAIPIVEPLKNQSLDFTRTIANMYYEKGNHLEIARHKIQHFLDYVRSHLHLSTDTVDDDFLEHLAARSNNTIQDTELLFKAIDRINKATHITQKELEAMNSLVETFKSNNTWKNL